ncbi:MAG: right-handed parallel beta-helix repeat-containing protein, partial [bacterium]|nr:right-handed parallel beta-helix repeat-containing protein [bacterium]
IDWARPPFSVGRVAATGPDWFDVEVFDEFPVQGGEKVGAFMDFDPATQLPRVNCHDSYDSVAATELLRPQALRVRLKRPLKIEPGVLMLLRHEVYGRSAVSAHGCKDYRLENITLYSCPGMAFTGGRCENVTLERCRVMIKPGTRRLMSATADGSHFGGCTGLLRIKDCLFEGMGDDGANIKSGLYLTVHERIDDHTIQGAHNLRMHDVPDPGDLMEFHHADDLLRYDGRRVKAVEPLPRTPETRGEVRVTFTEPLPEGVRAGDVLGNATRLCRAHISGTTVRRNRARGFLLQTRGVLVENCTFDACTAGGIMIISEVVHFFESISAHDVIVRNCLFKNTNYANPMGEGAVMVIGYLAGFKYPPKPGVFRNIEITGNTIDGTNNAGIFVTGADEIQSADNVFANVCRRPANPAVHAAAIQLISTRRAFLIGNRAPADGQGEGFKTALQIGDGSERETIVARDNVGF